MSGPFHWGHNEKIFAFRFDDFRHGGLFSSSNSIEP